MRRIAQRGFTLFEVMISLLVIVVAMVATMALLPVGIKAQQLSRSQMVASTVAMNMANYFHNSVGKFNALGSITPSVQSTTTAWYSSLTTSPAASQTAASGGLGWAGQMRVNAIYSSPYQYNPEQDLVGWFKGCLPVPIEIARRLDSDNDEIQKLLDRGGLLLYPDPNFLMGLNSGASSDRTIQMLPSNEMQKLVFAFTSFPQQNVLTSYPAESFPWYQLYPFPPAWLSIQAIGTEYRNQGAVPSEPSQGVKTGSNVVGVGMGDWSWSGGMLHFDDGGHAGYNPVFWRLPSREGQGNYNNAGWWDTQKPLDDPQAWDNGNNGGQNDADRGWYEGAGFFHGRNWRYFANHQGTVPYANQAGNLWLVGNGLGSTDPTYGSNSAGWAYYCFQRLAGVDDQWVGQPRGNYTNTYNVTVNGLNGNPAALTWESVDPLNNANTAGMTSATVAKPPSGSWPGHLPAKFYRAGWLPIRGLLDNPQQVMYGGNQWYDPTSTPPGAILPGPMKDTLSPQTCRPPATYEMRANYRDRAIDLWQAVMPTGSGLAVMNKNINALVDVDQGGTMVDCDHYEYGPDELNKFKIVMPQDLAKADWPIHPAQVLALSYLAHAAMVVTGYGEPFSEVDPHSAQMNNKKIAWEGLNWTYLRLPEEIAANATDPTAYPEISNGQGIVKDGLLVDPGVGGLASPDPANDAPPGQTWVMVKNDTKNPFVLYPGDVITFAESYQQWWYRFGLPNRPGNLGNGDIWANAEAAPMSGGTYESDGSVPPGATTFPNTNYRLHTFRVVGFNGQKTGAPAEVPGGTSVRVDFLPPLPSYPQNLADARSWPDTPMNAAVSIHAGSRIRRVCNMADRAFARKVYEMCLAWAQVYSAENPYDFGAPRMANRQMMMDKPISAFDLFWDAANGATNSANGQAVRTLLNPQGLTDVPANAAKESYYRWMVPNNNVPNSFFWNNVAPATNRHDVSHLGPTTWGANAWDQMVHNNQLQPPTADNDQKRFWPVKPFAPFHRARQLSFWSVDWKSYADAEDVPSAPIDIAKADLRVNSFTSLVANSGGNSVFPGLPESLYAWVSKKRDSRFVDTVGAENGGALFRYANTGVTVPSGSITIPYDVVLGHFGADRNGNGKHDVGPIPSTARLRATKVSDMIWYDPVLRVSSSN